MGQGTAKGSVRFYRRGTEPTAVQSHDKGHSTRLPPSLLRPGPCRTDLRHQLRAHPGGQDIHQQRDERRQTAGPYQWRGEPELRNKTRTLRLSQDNRHAFTSQRNLSGRWYARLSDNRRRIFAGDEHGVPRRVRDSPCRGFGQ